MKTNGKGPHMPQLGRIPVHAAQQPGITGDTPDVPKAPKLDLLDGARAVGMWILLERPPKNAERSKGGIILPDAVRERPMWIVRSIGEKVTIPVKVGDSVAFDGTRIMEDAESGTAWAFAMEGQIFGTLDPHKLQNRIIVQKAAP